MEKLKICNIGWATSIHVERWLKWFAARGHEVSLISNIPKEIDGVKGYDINSCPDGRGRLERYKELQFNFYCPPLNNTNRVIRIKKLIKEINPDIIHSHSLWYPGYLGAYMNFNPLVVTVFNGDALWVKEDMGVWEKMRTRRALKRANLVTGVSRELINACTIHGVNKEKLHVIRRGVDLKKFNLNYNIRKVRKKLGLPEKNSIVLSPRNLAGFYNLKNIIKAIPIIASRVKDAMFVFIWHEDDAGLELKWFAERMGVKDYVRFIGRVDHDSVALYHQSADVMISVSDKDSGPIALQEAMACGAVPVISDIPSVRELVNDGYNGMLVDPHNIKQIAEATIRILQSESLKKEFVFRNREVILKTCDQEREMNKVEELYCGLVKEAKR